MNTLAVIVVILLVGFLGLIFFPKKWRESDNKDINNLIGCLGMLIAAGIILLLLWMLGAL